MAKVLIDSGPITATLALRDVPRAQWRDLMLARRTFLAIKLSHDCRCLVEFCNDAIEMFNDCGFKSPEQMIRDGYGLEPEEVSIAVEWLKLNPPTEPIALKEAVRLGQQGGDRRSEKARADQGSNTTLKQPGRGRAYILARLDRDGYAELAAKVRASEMSANAAAIEAEFRKLPNPLKQIQKLWAKLDQKGRENHLEWTLNQCAICGRSGTWEGGQPNGKWCDACCEEGAASCCEDDAA